MGTAKTKSGRKAAIQEYERALADGAAEETAYGLRHIPTSSPARLS